MINAYLLTFGGFLLISGRLGDLFGHQRLFVAGIAIFTLASLVCGFAGSKALLIGARAVQGLGAAVVEAVALSLIVNLFPEASERAKAMGVYGFVASGGGSIGALLGGVLTNSLNWHWIFLVNVPIGALVFLLSLRLVPSDGGIAGERRLDVAGAVSVTASVMLAVYAVVNGSHRGWPSWQTLGLLATAALLFAAFLATEARAPSPLLPLRLFRLQTSRPRTSLASSGRRRCSPGSSSPPSICSSSSTTARSRSVSPSCPAA